MRPMGCELRASAGTAPRSAKAPESGARTGRRTGTPEGFTGVA